MIEQPSPIKASIADVTSGMLNAFIDPAAMAKQAVKKGFWIGPILLLSVVAIVFSLLTVPIALRVIQLNPPPNLTHEQFEKAYPMMKTAYYGFSLAIPVIIVSLLLLSAWLVGVLFSITGIEAKFSSIFSLMSACSLITMLQIVAGYIVLRLKGDDIQSTQELQPPLGLDIFFGGLKGVPYAILNFFSIFEIWFIVVLGLALASMARTSKGKAFVAITPAWLIPLLLRMLGAAFQPS